MLSALQLEPAGDLKLYTRLVRGVSVEGKGTPTAPERGWDLLAIWLRGGPSSSSLT